MQRDSSEPSPPSTPVTLEYSHQKERLPHASFSVLAVVMAVVTLIWIGYLRLHPGTNFNPVYDNPLRDALEENDLWPGGIGFVLAFVGSLQPRRTHILSLLAVALIVLAYAGWI